MSKTLLDYFKLSPRQRLIEDALNLSVFFDNVPIDSENKLIAWYKKTMEEKLK